MKSIKFTRKELHDLVWRESLPSIAKKYDTTYHDLRKICLTMVIPLPRAGYWQNLWLGKGVIVEPFQDSTSAQQECTLNLLEDGDTRTLKVKPEKVLKEELELCSNLNLTVPGRLTKPEAMIEAARRDLDKKNPWNFGHDAGMVSCSRDMLDIAVSKGNVGRALRFMDALIKVLNGRGNKVIIENGETYAVLEDEKVKIVFREKRKRYEIEEPSGYKSYGYKPTGILCFKMVIFYKDTEWKDGKLPLEEQLSIIVSTMEVKAREHKQEMLRWKIEREKQEEELRTIRAQEERIEKELAAFKRLLDNAQEWHRVEVAREYIEKVEKMLLAKSCASDDTKKWLSWARCMLDVYDPLNNDLNFIFSR